MSAGLRPCCKGAMSAGRISGIKDRINAAMKQRRVDHWYEIWIGPRRSFGVLLCVCLGYCFWVNPGEMVADLNGMAGLWCLVAVGLLAPNKWLVAIFALIGSVFLLWGASYLFLSPFLGPKYLPLTIAMFIASAIFFACSWLKHRELKRARADAATITPG